MKKVILGVVVLTMAVGLTGCGKTKQEKTVDDFTKKMEDINKDMTKEMKKVEKQVKKENKNTKQEIKNMQNVKKEKSAVEKLKETKELKSCLTKAATKSNAFDCYRALGGENFQDSDAAAMNLGINEWTSADKQQTLQQTDMIINMVQMQVNSQK